MKNLIHLIVFSILFSCTKTNENSIVNPIESGTNINLRSIYFIDDSVGFISGGFLYSEGILLKTEDRGNTWKIINTSLEGGAFGLSFFNKNLGLVSAWPSRIYRTEDGGKTFTVFDGVFDNIMRSPIFLDSINCIAVSGIGFESGLFWKSSDGGKNWSHDTINRAINSVEMQNAKEGFIAAYGLILKTSNGGDTWSTTESKGDNWMNVSFPSYNTGFAIGYEGKVIKTTNHGQNWTTMVEGNNFIFSSGQFTNMKFVSESRGYIIGFDGLMKFTNDGGFSWTSIAKFDNTNLRDIWMFNKTEGLLVGDNGKIYKVKVNI